MSGPYSETRTKSYMYWHFTHEKRTEVFILQFQNIPSQTVWMVMPFPV